MRTCRTLLAVALLALSSSMTAAQTPGGPPGGQGFGARRVQRLLQGITLTAEQQTKVDSITAATQAQLPPFTPGTPPDSATRQKMRDLMEHQDAAIRALLTVDQQRIWDANVTQTRSRMPRPPGNG